MTAMKTRTSTLPEDDQTLYSNIGDDNSRIDTLQQKSSDYRRAIAIIDSATSSGSDNTAGLYQVASLDVPYAQNLKRVLTSYNRLTQQYTSEYPEVQNVRAQVMELASKVKDGIQKELNITPSRIWSIEQKRNKTISDVKEVVETNGQDKTLQSAFDIYKQLYGEMSVKLEEAQTMRDLGSNDQKGYVVLDPPLLPNEPEDSKVALVIADGFVFGLFAGFLSAFAVELLDTRIMTSRAIEIFGKEIVAYLPDISPMKHG